jgi:UDP-3-O-[3-hydroxymyristoyl] glucosamine N-acyltransferase
MRLGDICETRGVELRRDGEFDNLGFLETGLDGMLVFLEAKRFARALTANLGVVAVLTTPDLAETVPGNLALAVSAEPRLAFARIHNHLAERGFYWEEFATSIDPLANVHSTAWVAPKNVRIRRGTVVGPQAAVLERCVVGEDVVVGAGAILGGVGFQTVRGAGALVEMRHAGGLVIGDRVHILPGAVVATALFRQNTEIFADVRVGSQAFVSHAVRIGERASVGHGAVVNGNVVIGEDARIGPGAVIANNLSIGDRAIVSLGAAVIRNVPAGARVSGNFAVSHKRLLRTMARETHSE